jgi:hypothetical protein
VIPCGSLKQVGRLIKKRVKKVDQELLAVNDTSDEVIRRLSAINYLPAAGHNKTNIEKPKSVLSVLTHLGIGFDEKSTICSAWHPLMCSGMSGMSEIKSGNVSSSCIRNNYAAKG